MCLVHVRLSRLLIISNNFFLSIKIDFYFHHNAWYVELSLVAIIVHTLQQNLV